MHTFRRGSMIKIFGFLLCLGTVFGSHVVEAQTYLCQPGAGPGGSACTKTWVLDATGASVPVDGTCNGCSIITKAQFDTFQAALVAYNPATVTARLAAGVVVTFSVGVGASGTYAA